MNKIRNGDQVIVIAGKDKGKQGSITKILSNGRCFVSGVQIIKRHTKPTKENKGELKDKTNKELINVFVPTTPNPTSGFLLMFPKEDVIYLDMGFEEASKFIVSAGTSNPKS